MKFLPNVFHVQAHSTSFFRRMIDYKVKIQTRAQGKASPIEIVQKKSENLREKLKPGANENNNTP